MQLPDDNPARGRTYVPSSPVIGTDPNDTVLEMLVKIGSTGHYLVSELIPSLQNQINDYQDLEETHKIASARLEGIGTRTITGRVIDRDGNEHQVERSGTILPGLGKHQLYVSAAASMGAVPVLHQANPWLDIRIRDNPA